MLRIMDGTPPQINISNARWYLIAALTAGLMAMVTVATKAGIERLGKDWFLLIMFFCSVPLLAPWGSIKSLWSKPAIRAVPSPQLASPKPVKIGPRGSFVLHTLCIAGAWLFYGTALTYLSASVAVFVSRIEGVILIGMAALFLKEKLGLPIILATVMAVTGIILIDQTRLPAESADDMRLGIILIFLSAILFAAGEIFARIAMKWWSARHFTFLRNILMTAIFLLLAMFGGQEFKIDLPGFGWALIAAVCGPVAARVLYLNCIRHIPVSHAAIMTNTEPVFGFIFGYLFFSEFPTAGQFAGAGLIAGAAITIGLKRRKVPLDLPVAASS